MSIDVAAPAAEAPPAPPPRRRRGVLALFAVTSVLTASLLFVVQPMVTRMVLPAFGGSPQVWTTSMLFFQVALLLGYGYSHLATTRIGPRRQPWLHVALLAVPVALLPIALTVAPSGRSGLAPSLELLAALTVGVAGPFVLLSTSGPLLQRWFSWTDHPHASDPYILYAAGNIGSIGGLLAYPFVLERALSVDDQSRWWTAGYLAAFVLVAACAIVATRGAASRPTPEFGRPAPSPPVGRRRAARWIGLAFVPSSAMLAASTYLSTDVAAVPLLWVVPLAIYLATFVIAFSRWSVTATRLATWAAVPVAVAALTLRPVTTGLLTAVAAQLGLVAVAGLVAHGRLAADRPPPAQLTRFYVLLAVGGALGGLANGILAPLLLPVVFEHGIIIAVVAWLAVAGRGVVAGHTGRERVTRLAVAAVAAALPLAAVAATWPDLGLTRRWVLLGLLAVLLLLSVPLLQVRTVAIGVTLIALIPGVQQLREADFIDRSFFGVHRVYTVSDGSMRQLFHGTTLHGVQYLGSSERSRLPAAYYAVGGPFSDVFDAYGDDGDVGILGLGSGGLAAYGRPGQTIVYHEIDPAVVPIAEDHFSYLRDSEADVEVVVGDGRLTLQDVDGRYALLFMDAFTSDAVPVHLLTVEAVEAFLEALTPDGVLVYHVSNQYLDLLPVVAGAADELGLDAVVGRTPFGLENAELALLVAMSPQEGRLDDLRAIGWEEIDVEPRPWTDQRSDLWSVVYR